MGKKKHMKKKQTTIEKNGPLHCKKEEQIFLKAFLFSYYVMDFIIFGFYFLKVKENQTTKKRVMFAQQQKQQQKQRQIELAADKVFEELSVDDVRGRISSAHKDIANRTRDISIYIGKHHNELVDVTDAVVKLADTTAALKNEVRTSEKVL